MCGLGRDAAQHRVRRVRFRTGVIERWIVSDRSVSFATIPSVVLASGSLVCPVSEVLRTALARTLNRAVGKLDLFGDSPRQREDGFHAIVGEVRCRIEHQRASAVDHVDIVLSTVGGRVR